MAVFRDFIITTTALALSGCASLGTNISGSFDCKAPGGSCAPTAVIDAQASLALLDAEEPGGRRRSIAAAQTARTGEQLLKIIFPGFVDDHGNLHEARAIHVIAQKPDWAAAIAGDDSLKAIAGRIARETDNSPRNRDIVESPAQDSAESGYPFIPKTDHDAFDLQSFSLPNRAVSPLTVREAIAGMKAPAIEGFDMNTPSHERTPHLTKKHPRLPSIEAIEAAKKRGPKEQSR